MLVNTGNGKGKSSAAFGVMLRALALDWKVAVLQFVKSGDWKVGEEKIGRQLGVDWQSFGDGFTWDSENLDERQGPRPHRLGRGQGTDRGRRAPARDPRRDRRTCAPGAGSTPTTSWRRSAIAPSDVNVIITGRDAPAAIVELADTVTEMNEIKHAYRQGIRAKRGIDY